MNLEQPAVRLFAIATLLVAFVGLFVFYGALEPAPEHNDYPGNGDLEAGPTAHVGEQIGISGTVVDTEPLVLEVEHADGTAEYVIENAPDAKVGQEVRLFGTIEADTSEGADARLEVDDAIVRDSWETTYMYAVSIVAALWVAIRAVQHWRFDAGSLGFVPRGDVDG
ncbi:hypothetical protein [Natronorubrum sp. A-ect3]|uniref:hypothetical protein n=1 Tax=Natronorubrum sp. A-ect3 TaxID=3242698 RepID=UPI00359ED35A